MVQLWSRSIAASVLCFGWCREAMVRVGCTGEGSAPGVSQKDPTRSRA